MKPEDAYNVTEMLSAASGNYYYSIRVLYYLKVRRSAWMVAQKMATKALDLTYDIGETLEEAEKELTDCYAIPVSNISTMTDAARELYEKHIQRNLSGESTLTGAPTGFAAFDERSGGLQAGNLVIVAGETSQGKTALAMAMSMHAAKAGYPIAFYSMEMTRTELFARMSATETGVSANRYLYAPLTQEEMVSFDKYIDQIPGIPIYFDDNSTSNIDIILSSIRVMVAKKGIKGAVIDYLQILNVNMKSSNKEQQMGEVARRLKNLAKDLGIWIIALSQLRRDEQNHLPTLNRLRDSGQIAEAADTVMLVYRPEVFGALYPEPFKNADTRATALIDVAKGRNIGLTKFLVGFDCATTRFYELKTIPKREKEEEPF